VRHILHDQIQVGPMFLLFLIEVVDQFDNVLVVDFFKDF
jgi:hypothetical protein